MIISIAGCRTYFDEMIRATRSRSSRPNHMPSHLDALQTMISVAFRRFLGRLHSVAKQASFDIASGSDFGGLRSDFGRFWEAKMEPKSNFGRLFFDAFFECVSAWISGRFLLISGGSKPRKSQKIACDNKNKSQHASPQFFSNPSTVAELAPTDSTPQVKPKRPPKSHPFTYVSD